MQEEMANFLTFQMRRAAQTGDSVAAMDQLQKFLELERRSKSARLDQAADLSNVRTLPLMRAVQ